MTDAPLRLVLFDWDGTLADSFSTIRIAMDEAFRERALPPPDVAVLRASVGLQLDTIVARLRPGAGAEERAAIAATYRACFAREMQRPGFREALFPGIREALSVLDGGSRLLGVATGKAAKGLAQCLAHHGLEQMFATLQTPDVAPGKPHPGMVLQAMEGLGVAPERTVVVGDTTWDMEMARNAGVAGVGVRWGLHEADALWAAGAVTVVDDAPALVAWLLSPRLSGR